MWLELVYWGDEQSSNTVLEMMDWSPHKFLAIQITRIYRFIPNFRENWLHSSALCLLTLTFKLQLAKLNRDLEGHSLDPGAQDLILPDLDCVPSSFQNHLVKSVYIFRKEYPSTVHTLHGRWRRKEAESIAALRRVIAHASEMGEVCRILRGGGSGGWMPDFSGWELYKHLKAEWHLNYKPILSYIQICCN